MKHLILNLILMSLPCLLQAQKNNGVKSDTLKAYQCRTSRQQRGDEVTYKINDKVVTKEYFQKITSINKEIEKCNPCYVKMYSVDEVLLETGTLYGKCPTRKADKPMELETETGKTMIIKSEVCKHSEWKYYDPTGTVSKVEHYEYGEKVE